MSTILSHVVEFIASSRAAGHESISINLHPDDVLKLQLEVDIIEPLPPGAVMYVLGVPVFPCPGLPRRDELEAP